MWKLARKHELLLSQIIMVQGKHRHLSKVDFILIKILNLLLFLVIVFVLVSLHILICSLVSLFYGLLLQRGSKFCLRYGRHTRPLRYA